MLPYYQVHEDNSEGIDRDMRRTQIDRSEIKNKGMILNNLQDEKEEPQKYDPSKEREEYEIE
jgi:hypothetical protein